MRYRFFLSYIHPAYDQLVGVRVLFYLNYLAYYYIFHVAAHMFHGLQIGAGHYHSVAELLYGSVYVNVIL